MAVYVHKFYLMMRSQCSVGPDLTPLMLLLCLNPDGKSRTIRGAVMSVNEDTEWDGAIP
jgi:hypothetical protein